jgi:hypothetical protein
VIIKLSKLVKNDNDTSSSLITEELLSALEQISEEFSNQGVVVEIEKV